MTRISVGNGQPEPHPDELAADQHLADMLAGDPLAEPEPGELEGAEDDTDPGEPGYPEDVADGPGGLAVVLGADYPAPVPPAPITEVAAAADPRAPEPEPGELEPLPGGWPEAFTASAETYHAAAELAAVVPPLAGTLSMYDASEPPSAPPHTDAVLIYAGGMTPHPWTPGQMEDQAARYFLPCWVARDSGAGAGTAEARAFLFWLTTRRAPAHCLVLLDLETRGAPTDLEYEAAFRAVIHQAGHWLMLYGSSGNLFEYPVPGGGYFVADPPPPGGKAFPHQYPHRGVTATQWRWSAPGEPWDLSVLSESLAPHLWDRHWATALLAEAQHMQASMLALIARLADYARTV